MISWAELPEWLSYLIKGLMLSLLLVFSAVIATRAGRNPYWALITLVPYVLPIALWVLAYTKWTKPAPMKRRKKT
jgi:hypothetical protein